MEIDAMRNVLTAGEWEALLSGGIPDQYRPLIRRLAVHHGVLPAEPCPTCGRPRATEESHV